MAAQSSDAPPTQDILPETAAAIRDGEVAPSATDTAYTEAGVEHASEGGLPQFETQWWAGQIFWLLILFAILYVLMAKVFLPRLRGVKDERAATIAGAVTVFRPQIVLIGGGVSNAGAFLLDRLNERAVCSVFAGDIIGAPPIVAAKLGNDAGIVGAAYLDQW